MAANFHYHLVVETQTNVTDLLFHCQPTNGNRNGTNSGSVAIVNYMFVNDMCYL